MRAVLTLGLAIGLGLLEIPSAGAQWFHNAEEDPFAKKSTHIVLTAKSGIGAGFRCTGPGDVTLVMLINERVTDETTKMLAVAKLKLLVIVDSAPVVELPAVAQITPEGRQYRIESDAEEVLAVLKATAAARRRLALALELLGQRFYSTTFNVQGSRRAIGRLMAGCKL